MIDCWVMSFEFKIMLEVYSTLLLPKVNLENISNCLLGLVLGAPKNLHNKISVEHSRNRIFWTQEMLQ